MGVINGVAVLDHQVAAERAPGGGLIVLLLAIQGFVDLPAYTRFGRVSAMGFLTIALVCATAAAVIACRVYPRRLVFAVTPYGLFLAWVATSVLWAPLTVMGAQNGAVYLLFGLAVLLSGTIAARHPLAMEWTIDRGVRWIDRIGLSLVLASLLMLGLPEGDGGWFIGPRSFALLGLLPLSWHLAQWQAGVGRSGVLAWLWVTAIGLSLSRTATGVAVLYVGIIFVLQLQWSLRSLLLRTPALALAFGITAFIIMGHTPMAERLFTGDTSIEVGGVAVNASGRLNIWTAVSDSARQSPIVGKGLGSSQLAAGVLDIDHPHNDYLRVWHDFGYIGLAMLMATFFGWSVQLLRSWRKLSRGGEPAPMQAAAFLALLGLLIVATTDNAIIYPFVMAPLGVLVGAGLGATAYGWGGPDALMREGEASWAS